MQRTISCFVVAWFAWSAQAAETGTIAEVYGCTYREGKTLEDLNAAAMQSSAAAFDAVASCESGLCLSTTLSNELPVQNNDTETAIEVYTCKINDGNTATDVESAEKSIVGATTGLGFPTYLLSPWLANTPFDNVYLSVSDDLGAFASNNSKYMTSSACADADAAIFSSQSCESGLWLGHLIRRPQAPAQ